MVQEREGWGKECKPSTNINRVLTDDDEEEIMPLHQEGDLCEAFCIVLHDRPEVEECGYQTYNNT